MHPCGSLGSPSDPQNLWCTSGNTQVHKIYVKKLYVCTYSPIQFTLRFVNLFVEVSRVWAVGPCPPPPFIFKDKLTVFQPGGRLWPSHYYSPHRIFRPVYGPVYYRHSAPRLFRAFIKTVTVNFLTFVHLHAWLFGAQAMVKVENDTDEKFSNINHHQLRGLWTHDD